MSLVVKNLVVLILLSISYPLYAFEVQSGGYVELVTLNEKTAADKGVGVNIGSLGVSGSKRKNLGGKFQYLYSAGFGLTLAKDEDSFEQRVRYSGTSVISEEESSVTGLSAFADIGHSADLSENIHSFIGVGATYYYLKREIPDCSGCDSDRINLPIAPYAKIGLDFCGKKNCVRLNFRQFFSSDFENAFLLSWQIKR